MLFFEKIKNIRLKIIAFTLIPLIISGCFIFRAGANDVLSAAPSTSPAADPCAAVQADFDFDAASCILMEASTGKILYADNEDESLPPASVTKIMTLLLVMEAIDSEKIKLDDMVSASAHACSMGGSQIYLKENEQMTVEDMLKSVVIASANDAALALAEYVAGSESSFVSMMNNRARELCMEHTVFENTNGLDDTAKNHVTSAEDIAIMSRELIKHKKILEYSSIWMDSVRNSTFGLTNTNRLVRFYRGCNGLKTGSTSKAGFCVSATAERDGMTLISVIMGASTRDSRNAAAASLLDWGFANFGLFRLDEGKTQPVHIMGGTENSVVGEYNTFSCVLPKTSINNVEVKADIPESLAAPLTKGDRIGGIKITLGDDVLGEIDITAATDITKIGYFGLLKRMIAKFLLI